jgi:hypothetical protein
MDAATYAQGLRDFADWLDNHADELDDTTIGNFSPPSTVYWFTHTREQFARAVRVLGRGAKSKDENWFNVKRDFGLITLEATCQRQIVCERIVKSTREVTTTVRDPEALEAVPLVEVTETIEDVEWVCPPALLAFVDSEVTA